MIWFLLGLLVSSSVRVTSVDVLQVDAPEWVWPIVAIAIILSFVFSWLMARNSGPWLQAREAEKAAKRMENEFRHHYQGRLSSG